MVKTSLIKSYLKSWTGENMQKVGKARRKRARWKSEVSESQKKLKGYRKEERAFMKRKKRVNKVLSNEANLMPKFKNKPMRLNKL